MEISLSLATNLIAEQFPQWAHLPIRPVELNGSDNRTFRLGEEMSIRLPSAEGYALQIQKEQKWLPILAPQLSFRIPEPLALGHPSKNYPWTWSVYKWIEGMSANSLVLDDLSLKPIASELAEFLNELRKIDSTGGPLPGLHNYWRGDHPSVYEAETRSAIAELQDIIDTKSATSVWEKAMSSKWGQDPVWIHGDFSSGNILVKDGKVAAIIDFGCVGIGDPACDLVIAWTFLKGKSREIFRREVGLDEETWLRARAWALWKATFELCQLEDKNGREALIQRRIIEEVVNEC